jgi:hypothetical protein
MPLCRYYTVLLLVLPLPLPLPFPFSLFVTSSFSTPPPLLSFLPLHHRRYGTLFQPLNLSQPPPPQSSPVLGPRPTLQVSPLSDQSRRSSFVPGPPQIILNNPPGGAFPGIDSVYVGKKIRSSPITDHRPPTTNHHHRPWTMNHELSTIINHQPPTTNTLTPLTRIRHHRPSPTTTIIIIVCRIHRVDLITTPNPISLGHDDGDEADRLHLNSTAIGSASQCDHPKRPLQRKPVNVWGGGNINFPPLFTIAILRDSYSTCTRPHPHYDAR